MFTANVFAANFNPLPDTGVSFAAGHVVCPPPGDPLAQDCSYGPTSGKLKRDFTDNGDGTIKDNNTGLVWMKEVADINLDNRINYALDSMKWEDAFKYCKNLFLGGHGGWRLPTLLELLTIAAFDPISALSSPFDLHGQVWTATPDLGRSLPGIALPDYMFSVVFDRKLIMLVPSMTTAEYNHVLCVSDPTPASNYAFIKNGDGTVTDPKTGLVWQQTADTKKREWLEALEYCETLNFANHSDWRLPDIIELTSLVDYNRSDPALDPSFDSNKSAFWSSTPFLLPPELDTTVMWAVDFSNGKPFRIGYATGLNVRCVRGGLLPVTGDPIIPDTLPMPSGPTAFYYSVGDGIALDPDPEKCRPMELIDNNNISTLIVNVPFFPEPVDIYLGIYAPSFKPDDVFQITNDGKGFAWWQSSGIKPWITNSSGYFKRIIPLINQFFWPKGKSLFYLAIVPANDTSFVKYYFWGMELLILELDSFEVEEDEGLE